MTNVVTTQNPNRPRPDSNRRIADLQSAPLDHLGTRPKNLAGWSQQATFPCNATTRRSQATRAAGNRPRR